MYKSRRMTVGVDSKIRKKARIFARAILKAEQDITLVVTMATGKTRGKLDKAAR